MTTVLFVDDEPRVLDGLRRGLRGERERFSLDFAGGGAEALDRMSRQPVDVLVSDLRMPAMDGVALLAAVQKQRPGTVRLVLSGHAEEEDVLRAAALAHRVLSKPCDVATLSNAIDKTSLAVQLRLPGELAGLVTRPLGLLLRPETRERLSRLVAAGIADDERLAILLESDPGLCAKAFQLAASPAFGSRGELLSIKETARRLGAQRLLRLTRDLVVCPPEEEEAVRALARRARATAQQASALMKGTRLEDAAFAAGLLCDAGMLLLLTARAEGYAAPAGGFLPASATANTLAAALFELWGLPQLICDVLRNVPAPERSFGSVRLVAQAVAMAGRDAPEIALTADPTFTGSFVSKAAPASSLPPIGFRA